MEDITAILSNTLSSSENVNFERLATEVVLALAGPLNLQQFYHNMCGLLFTTSMGSWEELTTFQMNKVTKLFKRYKRYKNPKVQWWFLGYFAGISEGKLRNTLEDIGEELIPLQLNITQFVQRFNEFDFASFSPDLLFQYDKKWYLVTVDVAVDDDTTIPVTCEVKLTEEEVLQLAGEALCKPIQSRHHESNRALVGFFLNQ